MDCFRIHNEFFQSHNSKRMIKFLLSFFVLSALFSLLPFILQSFKPFLRQFYSYYLVDKSFMFLLCNGLLVFIAMNSGPTNPPSKTTIQGVQEVASVGDNHQSSRYQFNASEVSATVAGEIVTAAEPPQEEEENSLVIAEQENALSEVVEKKTSLVIIEEKEEEEDEVGNAMMIIDELDAAEETEELNKKCEDFIRKMKAAFCSEPRADYSLDLENEKSSQVVLVH